MSDKTITHEQLDAEAACWDATSFRSQQLRRAAFTIRDLTAEVERLRGVAQQAIWMLNEWDESIISYQQGTGDSTTAKELAARLTARGA